MNPEPLQVTLEDFARCEWKNLPNEVDLRECFRYSSHCAAKAIELENAGHPKEGATWRLLAVVTSAALQAENKSEPFYPVWLETFTPDHLALFAALVPQIEDAELQARLCDILWLRARDVTMGRTAVESYLESACILEGHHWRECADRMERATHIGRSLGRDSPEFDRCIVAIEAMLARLDGADKMPLCAALMELLQDYEKGDAALYAPRCARAAENAEREAQWEQARRYRHIEAQWYYAEKQNEAGREARLEMAELHVREAEALAASSGAAKYLQACHHLERALKALQEIGGSGTRERRAELYTVLRQWQQPAMNELNARSFPVTAELGEVGTQLRQIAIDAVTEKTALEVIIALGALPLAVGSSKIRSQVEQHLRTSPIAMMFPFVQHTSDGLNTGRPAQGSMTAEERLQSEVEHQWHSRANAIRAHHVQQLVLPAIERINAEHNVHWV